MNKKIQITMNDVEFDIEETAYIVLKEYLDSIEKYFQNNEARREILEDIEINISEKFIEKLKLRRIKILKEKDIEDVISMIGKVEDFNNEDEDKHSTEEKVNSSQKRFYRDYENAIIAGVCSGLATYFNIDVLIVRILFVVLGIFTGIGFIAYIALWILTPKAKSYSQRMEMKGEKINFKNIEKNINEGINEFKREIKSERISKLFYTIINFFSTLIGLGIFIGALFSIIGINIMFILATFFQNYNGSAFFQAYTEIIKYIPVEVYYLVIISLYFIAVIPCIFLLMGGISLITKKFNSNKFVNLSLLILWIISICAMASVFIANFNNIDSYSKKFNFYSNEIQKEYDIKDFNEIEVNGFFEVEVIKSELYSVNILTSENLDSIKIENINNKLMINSVDYFCFACLNKRRTKVYIKTPSLKNIEISGASKLNLSDFEDLNIIKISGASVASINNIKSKNLEAIINGASKLEIFGDIQKLNLQVSGASRVDGKNLIVENLSTKISGASNVNIDAKNINIDISGASKFKYYTGNKIQTKNISGASKIEEVEKENLEQQENLNDTEIESVEGEI